MTFFRRYAIITSVKGGDLMSKICCFTGSRDIRGADVQNIKNKLEGLLIELIEKEGYTDFRTGGACGFDTLAALEVLKLKARYPHIRLHLILPCKNQEKYFNKTERCFYQTILEKADTKVFLHDKYSNSVMHERNRALVDGSDICVALLLRLHGGTYYTVNYAKQQKVPVINVKSL